MVITIQFDKNFSSPKNIICSSISTDESIPLHFKNKTESEIDIPEKKFPIHVKKENLWDCKGLTKFINFLFSLDGIYFNVFSFDLLPFSFDIPIYNYSSNLNLNAFDKSLLKTNAKSKRNWKIAVILQTFILLLAITFVGVVLYFSFSINLWVIVCITIAIFCIVSTISYRKASAVLSLLS